LNLLDPILGFDSTVEDGAVPALAEDLLVQGALAALALHPEITVLLLVELEFLLAFDINLLHPVNTVVTDHVLLGLEEVLATKAGFLHHCKFEDSGTNTSLARHYFMPGMFTRKEDSLGLVFEERLEDSIQWLLNLVIKVPIVVDRQVVLEHVEWIL
jgi:hypothetical protein